MPRIEGKQISIVGKTTFTLVNVPAIMPVSWAFTDNNFKVVSNSGNKVTVIPACYRSSSTLKASINLSGAKYEVASAPLSSNELWIVGDSYIPGTGGRYKVNYLPYNATLAWSYASGMRMKLQKDDYIDVTAVEVLNPYIEVKVTLQDGTVVSKRMELHNEELTSVNLVCLNSWREQIDGVYRKRYGFQATYEQSAIPTEHLTFVWKSTDITVVNNGRPSKTKLSGSASIATGGEVYGIIKRDTTRLVVIKDSVATIREDIDVMITDGGTKLPLGRSALSITGGGGLTPIPLYPTNLKDYAVVTLPTYEYKGTITCEVSDRYGNKYSKTYEISNEAIPVYHASPNPSNTVLNINRDDNGSASGESQRVTLNLYNNYGIVRTQTVNASDANTQIDVANLPNGNYYLNVIRNGEVIGKEIIIIKH